jgi:hypothetical protein
MRACVVYRPVSGAVAMQQPVRVLTGAGGGLGRHSHIAKRRGSKTNGPHSDGFSPAIPAAPHLGIPAVTSIIGGIVRGVRATPLAEPFGPLWWGRSVPGEKR